jgi:2-C-methyl-D-erythritol 4-phosphate cytidylyltransferase/2-C-methyl-D-erythritol 2,4-cyclodiphosphate synthase
VRAGIEALTGYAPEFVLVHDAARPFASPVLVSRAIGALADAMAAIPGLAVADTVKRVDPANRVAATLDRNHLRTVQTPQAFHLVTLRDAHRRALAAGRDDFTDDAALMEWAGVGVTVFEGEPGNIKLTTPDDFMRADRDRVADLADIRIGTGYDVHAFADGDHVMLGGIRVPHTSGLSGHSDADVVLHAAVDAILGALADGDIGHHFPPSDPRWRGAASEVFLRDAVARLRTRRGMLAHLDVTIVCEAPRIGPHRDAMRERIAEIAGIDVGRVAVKATTSERLGFMGRSEGMIAMVTATVRFPWSAP